jgi:hypothetical protein
VRGQSRPKRHGPSCRCRPDGRSYPRGRGYAPSVRRHPCLPVYRLPCDGICCIDGASMILRAVNPRALEHQLRVTFVGEVFRIDPRRQHRIGTVQSDISARVGSERADMAGIAIAPMQLPGMVIDKSGHEMQLKIRPRRDPDRISRMRRFPPRRSDQPGSVAPPIEDMAQQLVGAHQTKTPERRCRGSWPCR